MWSSTFLPDHHHPVFNLYQFIIYSALLCHFTHFESRLDLYHLQKVSHTKL